MLTFHAETYCLTLPDDRPFAYLDSPQGERLAELFVLSSIHTLQGRDDTLRISAWEVTEQPGVTLYTLHADSSVWRAKTYRLRCFPRRLTYEVEVEGLGQLAEVNYFGGYDSGHIRWGSGFFWSGQYFQQGFNPEPNTAEINHFSPEANSVINLMGVPLPGKADWFFTPPPFCFSMKTRNGWMALGVEAAPGENRFTEYCYHGQHSAFYLSLQYEGHTAVNGRYTLPAIGFDFGEDEYSALAVHVSALRQRKLVPSPEKTDKPVWWRTPIFCGWGSQCYLASLERGRAPDFARQASYETFLEILTRNEVLPGIVVLDDKWQVTYGENFVDEGKWPDLRGFISQQHAAGRKVLLWLKAWDPEGLPVEECITNAAGLPIACDPSNPLFEQRLRHAVRRMLAPSSQQHDNYDADGFKIDFTARIPSGPGLRLFGDAWGLELMRQYLEILYSEAKGVKPDALIMAHTPHPYLSDVVDMIRLNDINTGKDVNRAMTHRARIASIACPGAIIDTDNWPMTDKAAWRAYLQLQPALGVPSLYYTTHIDSTGEPLEAEDYRLIRETWKQFQA